MTTAKNRNRFIFKEIRDYLVITIGMFCYCVGWTIFLLPNDITTGGVPGISSILYWGTGIPVQMSYFVMNAALMLFALKVLGWKFLVKTIYAVITLTTMVSFAQHNLGELHLLSDQPFMAAILGAVFCGSGVGLALASNGSTGGTDIIAAIVNKYYDLSLGRVIMLADIIIVSCSYFVLDDIEKVIYGYVVLVVTAICIDQVVNSMRQSVQFFVISEKYKEISDKVRDISGRGCTIINSTGSLSGNEVHMLFIMARRYDSGLLIDIISSTDPKAYVSQSAVMGVYGDGFDHFKVRKKRYSDENKLTTK